MPGVTALFLIDTGAAHTVVTDETVRALNINSTASVNMFGVGGVVNDCPVYPVELTLIPGEANLVITTSVVAMKAESFSRTHAPINVLGRSALQHLKFTYDGPGGAFQLSARRRPH